jgi:hypothetical protein
MSDYTSVAARVAARKREHPELFCARDPRCLWQVKRADGTPLTPCQRHPLPQTTEKASA